MNVCEEFSNIITSVVTVGHSFHRSCLMVERFDLFSMVKNFVTSQ